jgi:hypothetical protein
VNLARPERVLKVKIRLLEEHKASMMFTCVEEAFEVLNNFRRIENQSGQLKNNTRSGVNAQGTSDLG